MNLFVKISHCLGAKPGVFLFVKDCLNALLKLSYHELE